MYQFDSVATDVLLSDQSKSSSSRRRCCRRCRSLFSSHQFYLLAKQISIQVTQLRRTGEQWLKQEIHSSCLSMVWKIVIIAVAMVISSIIIAGAIAAAQVLGGGFDIPDDIGQQPRGGGGSGQGSQQQQQGSSPAAVNGTKVSIIDNSKSNSYSPNPVEIKAGETITWVNDDSAVHTATSNDGTFDSDVLRRGQTFSFTFDKAGEYPYFCAIHPNMIGTVVVVAAAAS